MRAPFLAWPPRSALASRRPDSLCTPSVAADEPEQGATPAETSAAPLPSCTLAARTRGTSGSCSSRVRRATVSSVVDSSGARAPSLSSPRREPARAVSTLAAAALFPIARVRCAVNCPSESPPLNGSSPSSSARGAATPGANSFAAVLASPPSTASVRS
eukprot:354049-Pleurochrysis_carterae.AAC.2